MSQAIYGQGLITVLHSLSEDNQENGNEDLEWSCNVHTDKACAHQFVRKKVNRTKYMNISFLFQTGISYSFRRNLR